MKIGKPTVSSTVEPLRDSMNVRSLFPFLSDVTYLNTATIGPSWIGLADSVSMFYRFNESGNIGQRKWEHQVSHVQSVTASLLSVSKHQVYFTSSATDSLNRALLGLPLKAGDRIVIAKDEFSSVVQPCLSLKDRGIRIVTVDVAREAERCELLVAAVEAGAEAVAVSHVHWRTGSRINLKRLSDVCRNHGTWLVVDGVQAVGAIAVDASLADAYCFSCFKWLVSGFGLGVLQFSDRLAAKWAPTLRGYANEFPSVNPSHSHLNYPGIFALGATLDLFTSVGWNKIFQRVERLSSSLSTALRNLGLDVVTPEDAMAGIVAFRSATAPQIVASLAEQAIFVEDRGGIVRASPHFYNSETDIDRYVSALGKYTNLERTI